MRHFAPTVPSIQALALSDIRKPYAHFRVSNELLRFTQVATESFATAKSTLLAGFVYSNGRVYYASSNAGNSFFKDLDVSAPDFSPSAGSVTGVTVSPGALKSDLTATQWITATWAWNAGATVKRYDLSGHLVSTSIALPEACVRTSTLIKRIEAVCDINGSNSLVVLGCHNFALKLSTLKFFLVNTTTCTELRTILQVPFADDAATTYANWWEPVQYCANVYSISNSAGGFTVVANDSAAGRAVQFTLRNGIESQIDYVVPIDPDASDVTFAPTGLCKLGDFFYLSGFFTRPKSNDTAIRMNVYLTSDDGWYWSIGERSHFLSDNDAQTVIVPNQTGQPVIYAIGVSASTGYVLSSPARVIDGYGATENIDDKVLQWSLQGQGDSADGLSVRVDDPDVIPEGTVIDFSGGYEVSPGVESGGAIGRYVIDQLPVDTAFTGTQVPQSDAIDLAGRHLQDWRSPIDIDEWSITHHEDSLNTWGKLLLKTTNHNEDIEDLRPTADSVKQNTVVDGALESSALNDPVIGYSTDPDERDGQAYIEVEFQNTSGPCQQSVGLVFGGNAPTDTDTVAQFNAVTIPAVSTWTDYSHNNVELWQSNLAPIDADAATGGWQLPEQLSGILSTTLADSYAKCLQPLTDSPSTKEEVYRPVSAYTAPRGVVVQIVPRISGSKIQVYSKTKDYSPANCSSHAAYTLIAEFTFNEYARMRYAARPYWGLIMGADVVGNKEWFRQSMYGDLATQLTSAGEYANWVAVFKANHNNTSDHNDFNSSRSLDGSTPVDPHIYMHAGQRIRVTGAINNEFTVASIGDSDSGIDGWNWHVEGGDSAMATDLTIWTRAPSNIWGWADSGYAKTETTVGMIYTDPGARLIPDTIFGTGYFITDDYTAMVERRVMTNGVRHVLYSGNSNRQTGWDSTSPIDSANSWRLILNHGRFCEGSAQSQGLAPIGYFRVGDEYMLYVDHTERSLGTDTTAHDVTWCEIPTFYAPVNTAAEGSTTLKNALIGTYSLGHDLGKIEEYFPAGVRNVTHFAKGLLVEFDSRAYTDPTTEDNSDEVPSYHVADTNFSVNSGGVHDSSHLSSITLDNPMPFSTTNPVPRGTTGTLIKISGRGLLGSTKDKHSPDTPVVAYPMAFTNPPAEAPYPWLVRAHSFDHYAGRYNTTEDTIRYACALAGVRNVHFRDLAAWTGAPSYLAHSMGVSVSDFTLELTSHLYTNNTLNITFRDGNYRLKVQAAGYKGVVGALSLALSAPKWDSRILESVTVPISNLDITGDASGEATQHLRLTVRNNLIYVDCDGQLVWVFNLSRFNYTDTSDVYQELNWTNAGDVLINFESPISTIITARLVEMSSEIENQIIDMGMDGSSALSTLMGNRHIVSRPTQDGGMEFSPFRKRDDWSADGVSLTENVIQDEWINTALNVAGHVVVSGAEFGEWHDSAWLIENGYSFATSQNELLNNVQDSDEEARYLVRVGREQADRRQISCSVIWELQPEDRLDYAFNQPPLRIVPLTGYVVDSYQIQGDFSGVQMSLGLRKEEEL